MCFMESRENDRVVRGEALGQQRYIWLRSTWGQDGVAHFYYSVNGDDFSRWGPPIRCRTEHSGATDRYLLFQQSSRGWFGGCRLFPLCETLASRGRVNCFGI